LLAITVSNLMSRRVTLSDVAEKVGVSSQTVSRALNNKPDVSEETRRQILRVARQLGYRPNAVARSLSAQQSHTLGIITPHLNDPFYATVVANLEKEARRRGYTSFVSFIEYEYHPQDALSAYESILQRQVDGLVLLAPDPRTYEKIDFPVPLVSLAGPINHPQVINIDIDNIDGAYQAVRYLTELGHRQVGVICGPQHTKATADRLEGARRALAEIGSSLDPSYIQRSEDWSLDQGYKAAKLLLAQQSNLTAIFCQNDWLALGAYRAIREHNLRIPDDISVIGYDNVPVCLYVSPPLSSVQQPKATLGKLLAQLLINAVEQGVTDSQTMLLRAELIVRDSVSSVSKSN